MALTLLVAQLELENNLHFELGTLSAVEHQKLMQTTTGSFSIIIELLKELCNLNLVYPIYRKFLFLIIPYPYDLTPGIP